MVLRSVRSSIMVGQIGREREARQSNEGMIWRKYMSISRSACDLLLYTTPQFLAPAGLSRSKRATLDPCPFFRAAANDPQQGRRIQFSGISVSKTQRSNRWGRAFSPGIDLVCEVSRKRTVGAHISSYKDPANWSGWDFWGDVCKLVLK